MAPRAFGPRSDVVPADGVVSVTGARCAAAGCTSTTEATTATAPRTRTPRHARRGLVRRLCRDDRRPVTACTTRLMLPFPRGEINSAARVSRACTMGPPQRQWHGTASPGSLRRVGLPEVRLTVSARPPRRDHGGRPRGRVVHHTDDDGGGCRRRLRRFGFDLSDAGRVPKSYPPGRGTPLEPSVAEIVRLWPSRSKSISTLSPARRSWMIRATSAASSTD